MSALVACFAGEPDTNMKLVWGVLGLLASLGLFMLLWWIGEVTKLWWLLGKIRDRWQAGMDRYHESLPPARPCQFSGCQYDAGSGAYCMQHTMLMRGDL